jgi:hypothetical protein
VTWGSYTRGLSQIWAIFPEKILSMSGSPLEAFQRLFWSQPLFLVNQLQKLCHKTKQNKDKLQLAIYMNKS